VFLETDSAIRSIVAEKLFGRPSDIASGLLFLPICNQDT
jgi:hypothetical protein